MFQLICLSVTGNRFGYISNFRIGLIVFEYILLFWVRFGYVLGTFLVHLDMFCKIGIFLDRFREVRICSNIFDTFENIDLFYISLKGVTGIFTLCLNQIPNFGNYLIAY